jgi:hypothetical protein
LRFELGAERADAFRFGLRLGHGHTV